MHASLFRNWLMDDAGISFAYAHNLVHGHGLVAQVGAQPAEGFSNFLWTVLLSPLFLSPPLDPAIPVKIFSAACILITYLLLHKCINRHFSDTHSRGLIAAIILFALSFNSSFVIWTTSGLENPLYVLLSALYLFLVLEHAGTAVPDTSIPVYAAITGTLIGLTRPDGILFSFVFPLYLLLRIIGDRSRHRFLLRHVITYVVVVAVIYGGFMAFRYLYFNDTKPNPYYVKGAPTLMSGAELIMGTRYHAMKTYDLLSSMFSRRTGLVTILLIIVSTLFFFRTRNRLPYLVLLLMLLASWAVYSLLPDDWMGEFRYATPFFVFFYAYLCLIAVRFLTMVIERTAIRTVLILVLGVVLVVSTALLSIPRSRDFAADPPLPFHTAARLYGVQFNKYAESMNIEDATLLCPDVGGTLYFSRHLVYDLGGLCNREIAKMIKRDNKGLRDYVFDEIKPTFIHIHDYWSMIADFEYDPRFRRDYVTICEYVSTWAAERTDTVYYSGDYVRRDAISDREFLERLTGRMNVDCRQLQAGDIKEAQPFPRR